MRISPPIDLKINSNSKIHNSDETKSKEVGFFHQEETKESNKKQEKFEFLSESNSDSGSHNFNIDSESLSELDFCKKTS